jgi:uncharacterized protein
MVWTAAGLALGAVAGWAAFALGMPLPWLIGPLLACAAVSLAGIDLNQPTILRKTGQMVAAVAIGLTFQQSVVESLFGFIHIMVLAAGLSILGALLVARIMSRLAHTSFETAYFASLPGGVAEMSVLAERYGGETALVALAQSLRIIIVVLSVPPLIIFFVGEADFSIVGTAGAPFVPLALLAMLAVALTLSLLLDRMRVMNAWFLGGLAVGAVTAIGQVPASGVPVAVVDLAQVLIGCALGTRINRGVILKLRKFLPVCVSGTLGMIAFGACLAWVIAAWTGIDVAAMILATAPGGVAEMSITAKALNLAVPLVTAFHLVRVIMIIMFSAPLYRGIAWLRGGKVQQPAE